MNEILSELEKLAAQRAGELIADRRGGVPLVEYGSTFIPEELIRAAGANTYLMCSGGQQEAAEAVAPPPPSPYLAYRLAYAL